MGVTTFIREELNNIGCKTTKNNFPVTDVYFFIFGYV